MPLFVETLRVKNSRFMTTQGVQLPYICGHLKGDKLAYFSQPGLSTFPYFVKHNVVNMALFH